MSRKKLVWTILGFVALTLMASHMVGLADKSKVWLSPTYPRVGSYSKLVSTTNSLTLDPDDIYSTNRRPIIGHSGLQRLTTGLTPKDDFFNNWYEIRKLKSKLEDAVDNWSINRELTTGLTKPIYDWSRTRRQTRGLLDWSD
ncbi:MAG: hypothetical protein ACUVRS_08070 [Armatimonadota bacterium]